MAVPFARCWIGCMRLHKHVNEYLSVSAAKICVIDHKTKKALSGRRTEGADLALWTSDLHALRSPAQGYGAAVIDKY